VKPLPPLVLAVTGLLLLTAAGCGEKSEKERFADEGDELCKTLNEKQKESARALDEAKSGPERSRALDQSVRDQRPELNKLMRLKPPKEQEADYRQFVATIQEGLFALGAASQAARENDREALESIGKDADDVERRFKTQAEKLGFDTCASG
jgi:hypothetical protein